jgi:hypothetical protein
MPERIIFAESDAQYRFGASTGLLTVVAAGTASAGHIFAMRWGEPTKLFGLRYFRATWNTIAGFTAAQEIGLDLFITRTYTVAHSGGTAINVSGAGGFKKKTTHLTSSMVNNATQISTTGALTNGTHTIDAVAIAANQFSELATGAAVPKGRFCLEFVPENRGRIILAANEGLILRNQILMGAGGTARVNVEMEWEEYTA